MPAIKGTASILEDEPKVVLQANAGADSLVEIPTTQIERRVVGLFAANILNILAVVASFLVYSRLLTPQEFGLYAVALSASTLLSLILDGGLKTTIIKLHSQLEGDEEASIAVLMIAVSVGLIVLSAVSAKWILLLRPGITHDAKFVVLFVSTVLLFYPFVTLPTAKLERDLQYQHVAWIESLGTIVERGGPAIFLVFAGAGIYSFFWALLLSRILRSGILAKFHPINVFAGSVRSLSRSVKHLREGAWIQIGTLSSVVRDNLHTLLIGPLFGKEWIGYYAWALQVCLVSSQIFAQISARVSLPLLARAGSFKERWPRCLYQIRMLTMLTVPVLFAVWFLLPTVNRQFLHGKWQPALTLVPLLFLRMIPGMATTPLGPLTMVQRGGAAFGIVNVIWTAAELIGGIVFAKAFGPSGLAWSYAIFVWFGLWLFMVSLHENTWSLIADVSREITLRPSVVFALFATLMGVLVTKVSSIPTSHAWTVYAAAGTIVLGSYLLEPDLRGHFINAHSSTPS